MKKIIRKWFSIILIVSLCMTTTTPAMAASSKYNEAVSNYRRYMRMQNGRYKIVDIDGNGIPELLTHTWRNEIYTYNPKLGREYVWGQLHMGRDIIYQLHIQKSVIR